jgi:hypothetical protein
MNKCKRNHQKAKYSLVKWRDGKKVWVPESTGQSGNKAILEILYA